MSYLTYCTLPFKSVAFADICADTFEPHIQQLIQRPSVVGIRHILDDGAYAILTSNTIKQNFALLQQHNLSFDAQLSLTDTQSLAQLVSLAQQYPRLKIIINHGGWPPDMTINLQQALWVSSLRTLSSCDNIAIKLSGWEMFDRHWQEQQVQAVLGCCLEILGDSKVMLASNFPLCRFSMEYAQLWRTYRALPEVSTECFEKITSRNAKNWYRF